MLESYPRVEMLETPASGGGRAVSRRVLRAAREVTGEIWGDLGRSAEIVCRLVHNPQSSA